MDVDVKRGAGIGRGREKTAGGRERVIEGGSKKETDKIDT